MHVRVCRVLYVVSLYVHTVQYSILCSFFMLHTKRLSNRASQVPEQYLLWICMIFCKLDYDNVYCMCVCASVEVLWCSYIGPLLLHADNTGRMLLTHQVAT